MENETVTITIKELSMIMATCSAKAQRFPSDWPLKNYKDFLPAALLVKEMQEARKNVNCK